MKKKLLLSGIGIALLAGIVIAIYLLCFNKDVQTEKPQFSEHETISISIETIDANFFEKPDCIGLTKAQIEGEVKNVSIITDKSIIMKNIKIYEINGSTTLSFENEYIDDITFKTNAIYSANEVDIIFNKISNQIAENNNLPIAKILVIKNDFTEEEYTTPDVLIDKENKIKCEYTFDNVIKTIYTETDGNAYYIIVHTTKK